jgi:hypothetical protein
VIKYKKNRTTRWITIFLVLGLLWGGNLIFPEETNLEGLFKWSIKNYLERRYRETSKDLELLLSYCEEEHKQLKGKIYLLMGAVNEQLGNIKQARKNYQLSLEILRKTSIEGIDFTFLKEYQRIIQKEQKQKKTENIDKIEKPILKPEKRKKRHWYTYFWGVPLLPV